MTPMPAMPIPPMPTQAIPKWVTLTRVTSMHIKPTPTTLMCIMSTRAMPNWGTLIWTTLRHMILMPTIPMHTRPIRVRTIQVIPKPVTSTITTLATLRYDTILGDIRTTPTQAVLTIMMLMPTITMCTITMRVKPFWGTLMRVILTYTIPTPTTQIRSTPT